MSTPPMADTARLVAKLLANRPTPQEDIPTLIERVHVAISSLADPGDGASRAEAPSETVARRVAKAIAPSTDGGITEPAAARPRRRSLPVADDAPPPPPAPKLLRRAEVIADAATPANGLAGAALAGERGTVRGVVKWFDARERKGALRLPGYATDVPVDAAVMAESGIARLYKGQEVEAAMDGDAEAPRLVKLTLPGGATTGLPSGGIVRGRHAKPVVVELKREALRRVAARAEAEQVLGSNRPR